MHELQTIISKEQGCQMSGLIIDLRGNPGGPLPPALDLAALFLPRGKVLTQMSIQGSKMEVYKSTNRRPDKKTDLLLLTDESTASASEIFVAALQDNSRAKCMGTRTVGKNVAQAMMMLSDGSGLAFTVREYFSPLGKIMADGITPDYETAGPINLNSVRRRFGQWQIAENELITITPHP
jgi:carboxyl-terminal processing protease